MLGLGGPNIEPAPESNGHYERVPIRVGQFALAKNDDGELVFETTDADICDGGPKVVVTITDSGNGWSVEHRQGGYHMTIAPSADLHKERLARRRAFWHAAQFMAGRDLSHRERFSIMHQAGDDVDLFEDDAYFKNGDAITSDPFGEFLQ